MDLLRLGGMESVFDKAYAPWTPGPHLRWYTHGNVKQLNALSARLLQHFSTQGPLLPVNGKGPAGMVFVDVDDTVINVHSAKKQGAEVGYTRARPSTHCSPPPPPLNPPRPPRVRG